VCKLSMLLPCAKVSKKLFYVQSAPTLSQK
jgi:hypothetical protein